MRVFAGGRISNGPCHRYKTNKLLPIVVQLRCATYIDFCQTGLFVYESVLCIMACFPLY